MDLSITFYLNYLDSYLNIPKRDEPIDKFVTQRGLVEKFYDKNLSKLDYSFGRDQSATSFLIILIMLVINLLKKKILIKHVCLHY